MTERKKICRDCYKELTESGARLGVCRNCAGKEVKKLRKRLIVSFPCGSCPCGIGAGLPEPYLLGLLFSEAGRRCGRPSVFRQCSGE